MEFEIIQKYFTQLSADKVEKLIQLGNLYKEWNQKVNLISRKDINSLYEKHILHSLAIAKIIQFKKKSSILDIGTGGGFPGIPLALLFPDSHFTLVDSISKKINVVKDIAEKLELKNVEGISIRAEELKYKFDFIVSRAVTQMPIFYSWTKNKFLELNKNKLKNGILYLKGGDLSEELKSFPKAKIYPLKDFFEEDFFETKKIVYIPVK